MWSAWISLSAKAPLPKFTGLIILKIRMSSLRAKLFPPEMLKLLAPSKLSFKFLKKFPSIQIWSIITKFRFLLKITFTLSWSFAREARLKITFLGISSRYPRITFGGFWNSSAMDTKSSTTITSFIEIWSLRIFWSATEILKSEILD